MSILILLDRSYVIGHPIEVSLGRLLSEAGVVYRRVVGPILNSGKITIPFMNLGMPVCESKTASPAVTAAGHIEPGLVAERFHAAEGREMGVIDGVSCSSINMKTDEGPGEDMSFIFVTGLNGGQLPGTVPFAYPR